LSQKTGKLLIFIFHQCGQVSF